MAVRTGLRQRRRRHLRPPRPPCHPRASRARQARSQAVFRLWTPGEAGRWCLCALQVVRLASTCRSMVAPHGDGYLPRCLERALRSGSSTPWTATCLSPRPARHRRPQRTPCSSPTTAEEVGRVLIRLGRHNGSSLVEVMTGRWPVTAAKTARPARSNWTAPPIMAGLEPGGRRCRHSQGRCSSVTEPWGGSSGHP